MDDNQLAETLRAIADALAMNAAQRAGVPPQFQALAPAVIERGAKAVAKRKPSAYNRRYAAAYRRIKRAKTLKSGKMAKGFGGASGHKKIVKMAHAEAKKKARRRRR